MKLAAASHVNIDLDRRLVIVTARDPLGNEATAVLYPGDAKRVLEDALDNLNRALLNGEA